MTPKFMGRSASRDGVRTRDCTRDQATKRLIASFTGHEYVAERQKGCTSI
jgi:hypothetical protein